MSNHENAPQPQDDYGGHDECTDNTTKHGRNRAPRNGLPSLRIEVVAIDGDEGRKLHALQAQAVFEALLWLAEHKSDHGISEENACPTPAKSFTTMTTTSVCCRGCNQLPTGTR
jgi:hypothetical protein